MARELPRIGITSGTDAAAWGPQGSQWLPYATAVREAGGEAVHLSLEVLGREAAALRELDGLLLTGGVDVDLRLYPNPPDLGGRDPVEVMRQRAMRWDSMRDRYELALVAAALERDLPVLGICRGCQVLHVALGGRLVLDIPSEVETAVQHRSADRLPGSPSARHPIQVAPGTLLATILPAGQPIEVNSRHHQAAREEPGLPLRVTARCPADGVVEAIEAPQARWLVGVQWHPERPADADIRAAHGALFHAFLAACRGK